MFAWVSIGILAILSGAHLLVRPSFIRHFTWVATGSVSIFLFFLIQQTASLWQAWQNSAGIARYLLPPYTPLSYFISYSLTRLWLPFIISGAVASLLLLVIKLLRREKRERLFEKTEPGRIALVIFLLGQPLWLVFVVIALSLFALYALTQVWLLKNHERISFSLAWLPLALVIALTSPWLTQLPILSALQLGSAF